MKYYLVSYHLKKPNNKLVIGTFKVNIEEAQISREIIEKWQHSIQEVHPDNLSMYIIGWSEISKELFYDDLII